MTYECSKEQKDTQIRSLKLQFQLLITTFEFCFDAELKVVILEGSYFNHHYHRPPYEKIVGQGAPERTNTQKKGLSVKLSTLNFQIVIRRFVGKDDLR